MGKDFREEDIEKLKKIAICVGLALGIIAIIWSIIYKQKNTTIELNMKIGDESSVGSVMVEFDEDGNVKGSNESVACTTNVDPKDKTMYLLKFRAISEGNATIEVKAYMDGKLITYKYKIKVTE